MTEGNLFIISGPSGAGKSSVLKEVFKRLDNAYFSVSVTTRAKRPGEVEGAHYHFVSKDDFNQMREDGLLLEYAEFVGNMYGTPKEPIIEMTEAGKNVFLDIELQGVKKIKEKMPQAVSIFIIPPSRDELEKRLAARGTDNRETIQKRIETALRDCAEAHIFDYIVINSEITEAVEEILAIIAADKCRAKRRIGHIEKGNFDVR